METKTIRILLIEDNPDDVFFLRMVLNKVTATRFQLESAESLAAGLARLDAGDIEVVLLDLTLPDAAGMDTVHAVKAHANGRPIIVLSGVDDETLAVNAVHAGAEDYLVKGRVDSQLITRAIIYAIERTEFKGEVLKAQEKYRSIFENSVAGIFQTSPEGTYLDVNPALTRIYGYSSREELMSKISDIAKLLYVDKNRRAEFVKLMQERGMVQDFESQIYPQGRLRHLDRGKRPRRAQRPGTTPVLRRHGRGRDRAQGGRGKIALLRSPLPFHLAKVLRRHAPDRRARDHDRRQPGLLPDCRPAGRGAGRTPLHHHLCGFRGPGRHDAEVPPALCRKEN